MSKSRKNKRISIKAKRKPSRKKRIVAKAKRTLPGKKRISTKARRKVNPRAAQSRAEAMRDKLSAVEKKLEADEIRRAVDDGMHDLRME